MVKILSQLLKYFPYIRHHNIVMEIKDLEIEQNNLNFKHVFYKIMSYLHV